MFSASLANLMILCHRGLLFHFIPQVKFWITFNEPWATTWLGYGNGLFAPGYKVPAIPPYTATHNIIRSHVAAYHSYRQLYQPIQQGTSKPNDILVLIKTLLSK